ncbi:cytochrome c biogenesis protein CcsA [Paenibacillus lutrae]|uniref:C-type cytochrome biogenesis protein CcsB n=1 Tax=Paenibacillus lutrae TaxID=2078573 RepID=A0A7X3FI07_9BACL|nr:cytochrome c biogenesis protein CcsA [Paenibacillus lutrae]MVP00080.1 c-type cytochrome biogenesis protein CcsB [Paenibacillus lutrae]
MNWLAISGNALLISFVIYCIAFLIFVLAITGKTWSNRDAEKHSRKWGSAAYILSAVGLLSQIIYFFTRWYGGGHFPLSNMFEFMTFLGLAIMAAFLVMYAIYRTPVLGVFSLPVVVLMIAYAAVFPNEVQPLIPALQSYWLKIHVSTAAAGEAFFAVGFAAGLMYLLRTVNFDSKEARDRKEQRGVEFTLFVIFMLVAFIGSVFTFNAAGYEAKFTKESIVKSNDGTQNKVAQSVTYVLPPIVAPYQANLEHMDTFLGMDKPLFTAPSWMSGENAGRKLNTVVWTVLGGILLYGLLRLILRKPVGKAISPIMKGMEPEDLDEIGYRSIAIGYPIFTLGALIFAMIWAHKAWGRFWGWDPKEVWALIVWLFYAVFLHLRLSRGWQGKRSAWLAVIGFLVVMFTLVGVNLVIAGLHSYSGV